MFKKILIVASTGLFLFSIIGCDLISPTSPTSKSPLVGTWKWVSSSDNTVSGENPPTITQPSDLYSYKYVLHSDGTLSMPMTLFGSSGTLNGSWTSTADSVTIAVNDKDGKATPGTTYGYSISGSDLTLSRQYANGTGFNVEVQKYVKQ